jgi:flagellar hook-associated protein 3 FlgL
MSIQRYTSRLPYDRLLTGLRINFGRLLESQTQISTGVRVGKPSDDPAVAARILRGQRDLTEIAATGTAIASGNDLLSTAASNLTAVTGLLAEARAGLIQAMNGTLDPGARKVLASQFRGQREQLMELANVRSGDRYLYGGTSTTAPPFVQQGQQIVYQGDGLELNIDVGGGLVPVNLPGNKIFGLQDPSGATLVGSTGLSLGTTANQGQGESQITVTRTGSDLTGLIAFGIAAVNGGSDDSFVGPRNLAIDATAGTLQLGSGPVQALPAVGSPEAQDFAVHDEHGEVLHLDLSAFVLQDVTATIVGEATLGIGTAAASPIDFSEQDLQLKDPANSNSIHVDTTAIVRAGQELVFYAGAGDLFALLEGIAGDLENSEQWSVDELVDRLDIRLAELTRHEGNVAQAIGVLGSRSQRLQVSAERYQNLEFRVEGQLGELQDADLAQVVSELSQAELAVQLSQAAGSRLMNLSLLNYLR